MSRNDNAQTPDEGTGDTTYAFPAHLLGELDAPAADGVEPRVSAAAGPPSRSALLLVMRGPNAGSQFLLDQPVTSAGRHPDSDIFLDDATVSRHHVEFRLENGQFLLVDLDSLNNTYVNREPPAHGVALGEGRFPRHVARHSAANSVSSATAATKPPRRSRRYPSTDSGTIAEMDARSGPSLNDPFEEAIDDALSSLPADLRAAMSNVEIVVEDEPPDGQPLLGLYRGVPLPRRSSTYSGVLPDKISIFGGPLTRLAAGDADRLRREVRHVVLHEIAHHFGISDERLIELDRY